MHCPILLFRPDQERSPPPPVSPIPLISYSNLPANLLAAHGLTNTPTHARPAIPPTETAETVTPRDLVTPTACRPTQPTNPCNRFSKKRRTDTNTTELAESYLEGTKQLANAINNMTSTSKTQTRQNKVKVFADNLTQRIVDHCGEDMPERQWLVMRRKLSAAVDSVLYAEPDCEE